MKEFDIAIGAGVPKEFLVEAEQMGWKLNSFTQFRHGITYSQTLSFSGETPIILNVEVKERDYLHSYEVLLGIIRVGQAFGGNILLFNASWITKSTVDLTEWYSRLLIALKLVKDSVGESKQLL